MNKQNNSKIIKIESIQVGLASPERIRKWAERTLPNGKIIGQVTSSQTVNYKTLKPEKGGLFCERIFGPIKDFECACGRKKTQLNPHYCLDCLVEFTSSRVRRYRLGYIQLISPVTHVWYLKGTPSYISILLDMRRKKVEAITYCTETINISETISTESQLLHSKNFEILNLEDSTRVLAQEKKSLNSKTLPLWSSFQESNFQESKGKKIPINNYYTILQDCSWEIQDDWNKFLYYMISYPEDKDIPIPFYLSRIVFYFCLYNFYGSKSKRSKNTTFDGKKLYSSGTIGDDKRTLFESSQNSLSNLSEIREIYSNKFSNRNNFYNTNLKNKLKEIPEFYSNPQEFYSNPQEFYSNPQEFYSNPQLTLTLTGAEAIRYFLENLDLQFLDRQIRVELFELNEEMYELENQGLFFPSEQKRFKFLLYIRAKKIRRLKLVRYFRRTKVRPEWMILSIIPVLPPDLRPIIQLDGDQVAVSDLNKLYQKVLFRNNRMKRHRKNTSSTKSDEMKYAQRLLQEAVDALIENGKGGADPICASNERPLKSLSDMLKGKKGRFRQNLLGKRVDYSGRSVIVVGPKLKLHECGLPKEMAIELFQPFLIRRLMSKKFVRTIVGAKSLIKRQDPLIWPVLQQVVQNHPVLLNRAPTLHRLGIQAFQPKLVDGRAIILHPLVCTAFNADFDGDQMAVHVPLSFQARAEAWELMWSRNNLLSPATGQPILVPSQDMILGCYYLTTTNSKFQPGKGKYFLNLEDVIKSYNQKKISLHAPIWVSWSHLFETENEFEHPLEIRIDCYGNVIQIFSKFQKYYNPNKKKISQFIRTTPGRILLNQLILKIF